MAKQNKVTTTGSLRLIAGKWRGRKLKVLDIEGLRPTSDRIRETVFNWLKPVIGDANCLDLFAGTGALGFESASRGARWVDMVELNAKAALALQNNCQLLDADSCRVIQTTAQQFLINNSKQYDIVFIDPPFQTNLWSEAAQLLVDNDCLAENAHIYIEYPRKAELPKLPSQWQLLKDKRAGEVRYCLFSYQSGDAV
ncbi:MAG: 16S rRNA (guanine(966)-N(2))-methyltransferase RsmD [Methylophaga sp.]|nr:MAG: 16S rRNA (guanine(966)-N(2))-methyltransferase RsmD [Methylophaga sp.]